MANLLYHNEQTDAIPGVGGHMSTTVEIFDDGKLYANTHTWEDTLFRGFRGGVFIVLFDEHNDRWTTAVQLYGVDGRWIGPSDRTDQWSEQVPPDILATAKRIAIDQKGYPRNVQQDIATYLSAAKEDVGYLASIAQDLVKVFKPGPTPTPTPGPKPGVIGHFHGKVVAGDA